MASKLIMFTAFAMITININGNQQIEGLSRFSATAGNFFCLSFFFHLAKLIVMGLCCELCLCIIISMKIFPRNLYLHIDIMLAVNSMQTVMLCITCPRREVSRLAARLGICTSGQARR